jgi:hypothetical protein
MREKEEEEEKREKKNACILQGSGGGNEEECISNFGGTARMVEMFRGLDVIGKTILKMSQEQDGVLGMDYSGEAVMTLRIL